MFGKCEAIIFGADLILFFMDIKSINGVNVASNHRLHRCPLLSKGKKPE